MKALDRRGNKRLFSIGVVVAVMAVTIGALLLWLQPFGAGETARLKVEPASVIEVKVREGERYAFPWTQVESCEGPGQVGCFLVERAARDQITVSFDGFSVEGDDTVRPTGWRHQVKIGKDGTPFDLFPVKEDEYKERWVYAASTRPRGKAATLRFLQFPAFVTLDAKINREVVLDLEKRLLRDRYIVDAQKAVTLKGATGPEANPAIRGGKRVLLNGQEVAFAYANIWHLNLPVGVSQVEVVAELTPQETLCIDPVFEGEKMSLPVETVLRARNLASARPSGLAAGQQVRVVLRTFGLPQEVWASFEPLVEANPQPASVGQGKLVRDYLFEGTSELKLRFKPVIRIQDYTLPVLACLEAVK